MIFPRTTCKMHDLLKLDIFYDFFNSKIFYASYNTPNKQTH